MKKNQLALLLIGLVSCGLFFAFTYSNSFHIHKSSTLSIEGTSNVTDFSCDCTEKFGSRTFNSTVSKGKKTVYFENTRLNLTTTSLDCGHKGINRDMQKALQAEEYPQIRIELIKASPLSNSILISSSSKSYWSANTSITIAGVTQKINMQVEVIPLHNNQFRFISCQDLKMTDFGIIPPKPMMGLVKVRDEITIQFDLIVSVQ